MFGSGQWPTVTGLRPGAVTQARRIKPEIPETGDHGIPLRDELDLVRPAGVPSARLRPGCIGMSARIPVPAGHPPPGAFRLCAVVSEG